MGGYAGLQLHRLFARPSFRISSSLLRGWRRHSKPMATHTRLSGMGGHPARRDTGLAARRDLRLGGDTQTPDSRRNVAHGDKIQATSVNIRPHAHSACAYLRAEAQPRHHTSHTLRLHGSDMHRGHLHLFRLPQGEGRTRHALQGVQDGGLTGISYLLNIFT